MMPSKTTLTWYTPDEKMPDDDREVLAYIRIADLWMTITQACYSREFRRWWCDSVTMSLDVTMWAEVPASMPVSK